MQKAGNRLLVLNVALSGINKFLYAELEKRDWDMDCFDVPYPPYLKYWAQISTFRPNIRNWRRAYRSKLGQLKKSPHTFRWRSHYCEKLLNKHNNTYDVILQISGMFSPTFRYDDLQIPYTTFNDYNVALSIKYPDWSPPDKYISEWMRLEKTLQNNACAVFTTSENTRQSFIRDYSLDPNKVVNVGYGVTFDGIPKRVEQDYSSKTVLFVGIDFKRKGGYTLLNAFRIVRQSIPDARLTIVGPNKDLYEIDEPGVSMLGNISDREALQTIYTEASVFAMPSFCEPFGLVFLEAMSYRLPCIATNIDAMNEIIEDGQTGYLVAPGDEQSLAEHIVELLNDTGLCRKMGEAGHAKLLTSFSWDKVGGLVHDTLMKCTSASSD